MPDIREQVQTHLESGKLRESLTPLFVQTLKWGKPTGGPRPIAAGAPIGKVLTAQPVAQLGGLPVFRLDWPEVKLPSLTERRAVLHGLAAVAKEHLMCYVTADNEQVAFAWARQRGAHKTELRTLQFEDGVPARTTVEQLAELAFSFDEFKDGGPTVGQVTDRLNAAFDIEAVTDKFFKEFRDCFEDLKAALPKTIKQPADRHAFTQRLLNRLLFLCFLQKKRWLKSPDLEHPKDTYLFDLYDSLGKDEEFYDKYLYDLFFNGLNRPPVRGVDAERDRLWRTIGYVPFLNGGLFDPTDSFDQRGAVALSNKLLEPILGKTGLLRRYNFTVTESTPLNQEVAVDPEMLGKVFETVVLTSEEAEDYQAPNLRKATGSYYTPRIVVTFIVREVLKDYLVARVPGLDKAKVGRLMDIDASGGLSDDTLAYVSKQVTQKQAEAIRGRLNELRACDPAIGSGAFALGLLHELVNLHLLCETIERQKDPRFGNRNLVFDLKKRIIERSVYGADLQAKAVEICKLRLWLSLIVDYQVDADLDKCTAHQFEQAISRIPALPNLSYKIRRGDALLDLVRNQPFRLTEIERSIPMQDARAALERVHREFYELEDPAKKREKRLEALIHRTQLNRLQLESQRSRLAVAVTKQANMFVTETAAEKHVREAALLAVDEVLQEVKAIEGALQALRAKRTLTATDDDELNKLESSAESADITFAWELDFPEVFGVPQAAPVTMTGKMTALVNETAGQMELTAPETPRGGFDVIVGNPPFVTARNEEKRDAYAKRWSTCYKNYQLVAPFFERAFGLLRPDGHLGFIVSNGFAKREFGKPLVEAFFPKVDVQKVVDCSGLMFPGHGTPTCIVFGRNRTPAPTSTVRVAATLPGGGDLKTPPERSQLWDGLQTQHDRPGYSDERISISDQPRAEISKWPWNFDAGNSPTRKAVESAPHILLETLIDEPIGHVAITRTDDVFIVPENLARQKRIEPKQLRYLATGETIRDWSLLENPLIVFPYKDDLQPIDPKASPNTVDYLRSFKETLENVVMHGSVRKKETSVHWFEYSRLARPKLRTQLAIALPEIATHNHAVVDQSRSLFHQTVPVIKLSPSTKINDHHALTGVLNSSVSLFWLKQVCFNKNASDEEERDRFVYAGGKVEQFPIPAAVLDSGKLREQVTALSRACWERGQDLPGLAFKKLFEMEGEAYWAWNTALTGWIEPHSALRKRGQKGVRFETSEDLVALQAKALSERERLRAEMIALQEEMDWLVYDAYGLLKDEGGRQRAEVLWNFDPAKPLSIEPLALGERPFELLRDGKPIPAHFSAARRALWQARLKVIQDNEHIRRIEQPVYKRRWYRKVSDEQEFERAFEWWLLEKAEWWLEKKAKGGPIALSQWADALWADERVQAAAQVIDPEIGEAADIKTMALPGMPISTPNGFIKLCKSIIIEATVPDWIPAAMDWEQVEKKYKTKVPARARRIRGKLNVPRERFRQTEDDRFVWAGK